MIFWGFWGIWGDFFGSSKSQRVVQWALRGGLIYIYIYIYIYIVNYFFSRPRTWVFLPTKTPMLTFIKNIFIADSRVSDHVESESGVKKKTQLRGDFRSGEKFFLPYTHIYIWFLSQIPSVCFESYYYYVMSLI